MTQTIYVKFSYENRVSELVPIHTQLDLSKNSNRTKLQQQYNTLKKQQQDEIDKVVNSQDDAQN